MKKITAIILIVAVCFALSATALAAAPTFPDIYDPQVAKDVAVLQMMGAIEGSGGQFMPGGFLTRAQFCKIAVIVMGRGEEEVQYRNRTIFPDVRSTHWARGYINLAVSGDDKIIIGTSDGTFKPDNNITYAEAITILCRMLGYKDADVGMQWPTGYLTLASEIKLTEGVNVASSAAIPRSAAARLFKNLLATEMKGGGIYASKLGIANDGVMVMDVNATASDGTPGAIRTSDGVFKAKTGIVPSVFAGQKGILVTDSKGLAITFIPGGERSETVIAASANTGSLTTSSGTVINIPPATPAYTHEGKSTFGDRFIDIGVGMAVTVFYTDAGKVDAVYINTKLAETAVVATQAANLSQFSSLTGGSTEYNIVKNGVPASAGDILKYDVATYDSASRTLNVTDFRLTGCYEDVWPNMEYPTRITMYGIDFNVLPSAVKQLSTRKLGDVFTILLTPDNQVAGAVEIVEASTTAVGIVDEGSTNAETTVTLFNGTKLSGAMQDSGGIDDLIGDLVIVTSYKIGTISVRRVAASEATGDFNLTNMTLGTATVAKNVQILERVGKSAVAPISLSDIHQDKISASKILFSGSDLSGRVNIIVLNDVTGDLYHYGFLKETILTESDGGLTVSNRAVSLTNSEMELKETITGIPFKNGLGGVAFTKDGKDVTAIVMLTAVENVKRGSFRTDSGSTYVSVNGSEILVAENVQCYNKITGKWFKSLSDARAFSDNLTVYYDRSPADNGKVRVVVAN